MCNAGFWVRYCHMDVPRGKDGNPAPLVMVPKRNNTTCVHGSVQNLGDVFPNGKIMRSCCTVYQCAEEDAEVDGCVSAARSAGGALFSSASSPAPARSQLAAQTLLSRLLTDSPSKQHEILTALQQIDDQS